MERGGLIRSVGVISVLTGVSRVLGLFRDMVLAGHFGASMAMSAFVVAFKLPNLFRGLFGEGALSAAFIPVFVEARHEGGDTSAWQLAREVFTLLALVLLGLVAIGMLALSVTLRAPDLVPRVELALRLARIMLPYLWFMCMAAGAMGILNAYHRFAVPAAAPWLLNLVLMAAAVWAGPLFGAAAEERIYAVAWGVVLAGFLQAGIHWPALVRLGFRFRPARARPGSRMGKVLRLMGPAALGRAATQVNVLVDSLLALWIGAWAPAALYFSERLVQLPIGLFATALATVLLPVLSAQSASGDRRAGLRTVNESLRLLLFIMTPAAFFMAALSEPLVRGFFQWGVFDAESVVLSARALRFYAPMLVFLPLSKVLVPFFHAQQDTRTPLRVGVGAVGVNIVLSVVFMRTWPEGYRHAGIAFATVVSSGLAGAGLAVRLHRRVGSPGWTTVGISLVRFLAGGGVLAISAHASYAPVLRALSGMGPERLALLLAPIVSGLVGAAAYVVTVVAFRGREWAEMRAAVRRRSS